jgi:hypothetical protein
VGGGGTRPEEKAVRGRQWSPEGAQAGGSSGQRGVSRLVVGGA